MLQIYGGFVVRSGSMGLLVQCVGNLIENVTISELLSMTSYTDTFMKHRMMAPIQSSNDAASVNLIQQ